MKLLYTILLCCGLFASNTERDSAAHALAITEANDKAYNYPTSDSLICFATDYYDRHGTKRERAKAHFYLGCVEADLFRRAEAIYQLRLAERLNPDKESNLQALIYSRLGYLLYEHQLTDEAQEIYTKAYTLSLLRRDTIDRIYSSMQLGNVLEAWELAEAYKDVQDVRPTVLAALYDFYKLQSMPAEAYQAAQLCMELAPHPMRTWQAMYNLGEALYEKQEYDSAQALLKPILDIDHSYQLRANTASILENIALAEGNVEQAKVYSELHKALQRSAYTSLETSNVLRRELDELEQQERQNHIQKILLIVTIIILFMLIALIIGIIWKRYRQHRSLKHDIGSMRQHRQALVQEDFESSQVYQKLHEITQLAKENPFTKENLDAGDWQQLLIYADEQFAGISTHLRQQYHLTEDELHICILMLFQVPVSQIGHFVKGYTRNTIQLKARQIPQRAGAAKGTLLRNWLNDEIANLNRRY